MNIDVLINDTLNRLKDFQRKTVDAAICSLSNGQNRFLIADEVGLGKTIVAKGIITRLVAENSQEGQMLNVIYICSNQALAKQILSKLSYAQKTSDTDEEYKNVIDYSQEDDRITSLAYERKPKKNKFFLNIRALTPATSFDNGNLGRADERILLYRILKSYPEYYYRHIALKWFLKGGKSEIQWNKLIDEADQLDLNIRKEPRDKDCKWVIRNKVFSKFRGELKKPLDYKKFKRVYEKFQITKEISFWKVLINILAERKTNKGSEKMLADKSIRSIYYQLVAELRFRLSIVCKDFLKADLFILDEFQRYSNLIQTTNENDDPGTFIAKSVFSKPEAKIIMLSATPFKAYTTKIEEYEGENHYEEFRRVLAFLLQDKSYEFWQQLNAENKLFFKIIHSFQNNKGNLEQLKQVKEKIEKKYRICIARTERTLVETIGNEAVENSILPLHINKEDIIDFLSTDEIIKAIDEERKKKLPIPVEYVKSSPYPFSFLQDYEHMRVLQELVKENKQIRKIAKNAKRAWLPIERLNNYKALLPESDANKLKEPNAKLRVLYDETVRNKGWQLLWVPPSINYYNVVKGAFVNAEDFTKTLIFSSWKMVPRMVSALVSYEAERLSVGKFLENSNQTDFHYNDKKRYPYPLLTYKNTDGKLAGMNNIILSYPSVYLANIYDPSINISEKKTLGEIKSALSSRIKRSLLALDILSLGSKGGDVQKWDWYAILLLDKSHSSNNSFEWMNSFYNETIYDGENEKQENGKSGKESHFLELKNCLNDHYEPGIGKLNLAQLDKLCEHLATLALGAPGICSYRSLRKVFDENSNSIFESAIILGQAFNTMFNKPESIAIVNQFENEKFYHENVVQYAISGNIQAMLDEFIYQLKDSGGIENAHDCADFIRNILTVTPGSIEVKSIDTLEQPSEKGFNIRTHYAIPFGLGSAAELKNGARQVKVREAFNSPFRPFVLTSTSIGQEGLDFHYYCSKLIHWNLPSNPIDLEQREGRIKRFKGLNIRKAISRKYKSELLLSGENVNIWDSLFQLAEQNKPINQCDLIPFWHCHEDENSKIKTIIPIYQYSKDFEKLKNIKAVLGSYRLTFGQPRQEELVQTLNNLMQEADAKNLLKSLIINLAPVTFI